MLGAAAAAAAEPGPTPADFKKLLERVGKLEQRNRELESLQRRTDEALASDRLSENDPEIATRLKAVEFQTLEMQHQARRIEALDGVSVAASVTAMLQQVNAGGSDDGTRQTRASYRGDVAVTLPGGSVGDAEGRIFAQVRLGQGTGVGLRPAYTSTLNSSAFETAAGPDDSFAILAQAWYQLDVPLPRGGVKQHSTQRLEINVGKIDPFVFFDQNAAADDETMRFLNNALVHNPLLDAGGDAGVDAYGFAPGARLAYVSERDQPWGASIGVFGSGPGANFSGSPGRPFVIAQIDAAPRFFTGLPGNYRLYAWRNGRAEGFDGAPARHAGWGVSADQRVGDDWTLFARFGRQASGRVRVDRALTLGAEADGSAWGRSADAVGLGFAWLDTSAAYRDASADGSLAGYVATGAERIAELYYRFHLNEHVELSPDLQLIRRAGADGSTPSVHGFGLRLKVGL